MLIKIKIINRNILIIINSVFILQLFYEHYIKYINKCNKQGTITFALKFSNINLREI
jgi:hypothetical protein